MHIAATARMWNTRMVMRWSIFTLAAATILPTHAADILLSEFKVRRAELMGRLPDGIVLLHARADFASQNATYQYANHQDPSFYYFSGNGMTLSSILAVDGISRETWLFASSKLSGYAGLIPLPPPGAATAASFGIDHAVAWRSLCRGSIFGLHLVGLPPYT
jgi:hypothetical protein